jgi:NAD(P)-dependent dehydrogenase (short-subunit alcohol dehydrogenase family)
VVHNGRYIGPGHMDRFMDTPIDLLRKQVEANLFAPLIINQLVLPGMIERGEGTFVNITSTSAYGDPLRPAGAGGWGMGYGISKAAFHRIAGVLKTEFGERGLRFFNVQPGFIATERMAQDMKKYGFIGGVAPDIPAKVIAWLCTDSAADEFNGKTIEAQQFCHERNLMPGWDGPYVSKEDGIAYDLAGYNREQIRKAERAAQLHDNGEGGRHA